MHIIISFILSHWIVDCSEHTVFSIQHAISVCRAIFPNLVYDNELNTNLSVSCLYFINDSYCGEFQMNFQFPVSTKTHSDECVWQSVNEKCQNDVVAQIHHNIISMSSTIFILVNNNDQASGREREQSTRVSVINVSLKNAPNPILSSYRPLSQLSREKVDVFAPKWRCIAFSFLHSFVVFLVCLISSSVRLLFLSGIRERDNFSLSLLIQNILFSHKNMFLCASGLCCVCVFYWALEEENGDKWEIKVYMREWVSEWANVCSSCAWTFCDRCLKLIMKLNGRIL